MRDLEKDNVSPQEYKENMAKFQVSHSTWYKVAYWIFTQHVKFWFLNQIYL